jgi:hypothetical protein
MRHLKNKITSLSVALASLPGVAFAQQTAGQIIDDLTSQTESFAPFLSIISFVLGIGLAIAGLMKFYNISKNPNDPSNKMSTAFILMFVGAGLVAIPAVLGTGVTTIFGGTDGTVGVGDAFRGL